MVCRKGIIMIPIKEIVASHLKKITIIIVSIIIIVFIIYQISNERNNIENKALQNFELIEKIMQENNVDFATVEDNIKGRLLGAAEIVSYMTTNHPELVYSKEWYKELAELLSVDDILIFNDKGVAIGGTNDEALGLTFEDGEQISYFKPLLENKSLKLTQGLSPRTIDGKKYRYAAVWNQQDSLIIQVGTSDDSIRNVVERFDLSYVFTLLQAGHNLEIYSFDNKSKNILASTMDGDLGKSIDEIINESTVLNKEEVCHSVKLNGIKYYTVSRRVNDSIITYNVPIKEVYKEVLPKVFEIIILLLVLAYLITCTVTKYVERLVINNLQKVNNKLANISEGDLETSIELNDSKEFSELGTYINDMVHSLKEGAKEKERLFNIVSRHSNRILYRYDIEKRITLPWDEENAKKDILSHLYKNVYSRDEVDNNEFVLSDSSEDVKTFFSNIHKGVPDGELKIHIKLKSGELKWYNFRYSTVLHNEKPAYAMISIEDITKEHEHELVYLRHLNIMEKANKIYLLYVESDLTNDVVENMQGSSLPKGFDFSELSHTNLESIFSEKLFEIKNGDYKIKFFSIYDLRELYYKGEKQFQEDLEVIYKDMSRHWLEVSITLLQDPFNGHIKCLAYMVDVTKDREEKLSILQKAEYDAMTGLLRKGEGEQRIKNIMLENTGTGGVLIALDLDDLKGINDNLGHKQGDKAIIGIAEILRKNFRKDDVLIRSGGDEFIVFLPGAANAIRSVRQTMISLLQKLSLISIGENNERNIHCSAGCAVEIIGEDTYDSLFKKADQALYHVKRNGKNNFAFFIDEMEKEDYEFRSRKLLSDDLQDKLDFHELQNLLSSMMKCYEEVIMFNLSDNTYHIMRSDNKLWNNLKDKGLIEDFLDKISDIMHLDDLMKYREVMEKDNMMKLYTEGTENLTLSVRVKQGNTNRNLISTVIFHKNERGDICLLNMFH